MAGLFLLPHSVKKGPEEFFEKIEGLSIDSLNVSVKYHASRHLSIRNGGEMIHTNDGEHFYKPDSRNYPGLSPLPISPNMLLSNEEISNLINAGKERGISVGAWSVFLHDEHFGKSNPGTFVTNVFGQSLRPNLCPTNELAQTYLKGHINDLVTLGFSHICFESIAYSGFRHGDHHERFFFDLSLTTDFLLSLCFCAYCQKQSIAFNVDFDNLKTSLENRLIAVLTSQDPWKDKPLSMELIVDEFGDEMRKFLESRISSISELHSELTKITREAGAISRFLDSSPISNRESQTPYDDLWQYGIQKENLIKCFDFIQPLLYRFTRDDLLGVARKYIETFPEEKLIPVIRPMFPDISSEADLVDRIARLREDFQNPLDFYLFELIRKEELGAIRNLT